MKRLGLAIVAVGVVVLSVIARPVFGQEAPPTPKPPYTNQIGVYINSYNGDTHGTIVCDREYTHETGPEGDATMFIENQPPQRMVCIITIKKNVSI